MIQMTALAQLTRRDRVTAELHADYKWYSPDGAWARLLNLKYDPTMSTARGVGGMPAYVHTVAPAAEEYRCQVRYPWTGSATIPGAAY